MADSKAPRPLFARKRLNTGVVGLLLLLTLVVLYFVVFCGDPMEPLKVTFLRFDQSRDGKVTVAVVRLENRSKETVRLCSIDNFETVCGQVISRGATNDLGLAIPGTNAVALVDL